MADKPSFSIWVDADSCPVQVRSLVLRFAVRLEIKTYFVANRNIPVKSSLPVPKNLVKMVITRQAQDAADDYIAGNAGTDDIVVTRDIPLAARLVERSITVINDRGTAFTKENIRERLSVRNFNLELARSGIQPDRKSAYGRKNLSEFSNCLDKAVQAKLAGPGQAAGPG